MASSSGAARPTSLKERMAMLNLAQVASGGGPPPGGAAAAPRPGTALQRAGSSTSS